MELGGEEVKRKKKVGCRECFEVRTDGCFNVADLSRKDRGCDPSWCLVAGGLCSSRHGTRRAPEPHLHAPRLTPPYASRQIRI